MLKAEDIRLRDFRQLQGEIRGSRGYLVVGIDVAKKRHSAFLARPRARRF